MTIAAALLQASVAGAQSEAVTTTGDLAGNVALRDVQVQDGLVSGSVANRSRNALRDVQLLVRHAWVWDDDRHPGAINPGTSSYVTVAGPIPPGGEAPFSFRYPSSAVESGAPGHFTTAVEAVGDTEVIVPGTP
jgi:hypothetical protein